MTRPAGEGALDDVLGQLGNLVDGPFRREMVAGLASRGDGRMALAELGTMMRTHRWPAAARRVDLAAAVRALDRRTRADGFHALHDWDGVAGRISSEPIAVELLTLAIERRGAGQAEPAVLAILFDYYVLYLLALAALRVWDGPDPDAAVDRIAHVLSLLQGPAGSGQQFVRIVETLWLVGTSHYEADEGAYVRLLDRTRGLRAARQAALALGHAAGMGCHLRFGFEATYARNIGAMRDDNAADYPWLSYALATSLAEYDRLAGDEAAASARLAVADAILNGLSPDPEAFVGDAAIQAPIDAAERRTIRELVAGHRTALAADFARLRPADDAYSPLSLFCNFCQNVVKGAVLDAVLWGEASPVSLDDLLSSRSSGEAGDVARLGVVRTLMGYARSNPHRIRGRLMPVIVYDPHAGRRAYGAVLRALG
ncbi:MAG TPA: hypothetical protein VMM93_06055 [Vicinamibacterales bacterium]|nr:hypothetical protein [Vicinamibacterales bacterium]